MAESFREKRLRELSGTTNSRNSDDSTSFRERRKQELQNAVDIAPNPNFTGTRQPLQPMVSQTDFKALGEQLKADEKKNQQRAAEQETIDNYVQGQAKKRQENEFFPEPVRNVLDTAAGAIDRALVNNPVGRFINRFSQGAGQAVGVDTQEAGAAPLLSTGNRAVDVTADVAGNIAGTLTNPSNIGQGLVSAPLRAGQAVVQRFAPRAPQLAQRAIEGATAGAIQGGVIGGVRGETSAGEMARNVGLGAATGAIADPLAELAGRGIRRGVNAIRNRNQGTPNTNLFTRLFGEEGVGITPAGSKKSNRMVTTEQQIVGNPIRRSAKGAWESTKQTARTGFQTAVDYLSPLKKINRDVYDSAMDAARANNVANTIIRDKFVDNQGNVIGNSLNDIMKKTRGLGKKFDDYLVLRHAITRMQRGERVYDDALKMTPEKAAKAVQTLEARYPQLRELGRQWDEFNANLLDSGVREGIISEAARDAMRTANPNYASMRRQFDISEKFARPKQGAGGSAFSGQKAPIKQVSPTGSTRKIVSPIRSAIEQTYAWKNAELRNRTMQQIVRAIQADPSGMKGIAEIVKKPSTSYKNLDDALREGGSEEFLELLDNDFKSLFKKSASGDENIVRAMVKGQPVYVKVNDPESVKALLGLGAEQADIITRAFEKLSNATKRGATGILAPMFSVKSLVGDTVQAAIQAPNAIKHVTVDVPAALVSSIADVLRIPGLRNLAEDFRRVGGEYSALLFGDRPLNRSVYQLRRESPFTPQGVAKGVYNTVRGIGKGFERVADLTENLNRMAAYRRAMVGKERTPENIRNALNAAREATVNYSRKGTMTRAVESFSPYTNAAVQGIYRMVKNFSDPKTAVKTLAGVGTLIVAPKLYEFARFHNDPDYQKLPARERYRNIIYDKNADGTFKKQPMPPEYLAIGAFINDVLSDVVDNNPNAYKGTLDAVVNAYTPGIISGTLQGITQGTEANESALEKGLWGGLNASVLAPFTATAANQSFTGAPIVPQRLEGLSPRNQSDERTSAVGKWIGEQLNISPMKVDYLIRAYGGDPARLILPLTSDVGGGTARNTLLKNFIVDPVFTNTLADDFYTAQQRLETVKKDFDDAGDPLPSWYSEDLRKLVTSRAKNSVLVRLSDLQKQKREVQGNRMLRADVKAQRLRDIQSEINQIYFDVNAQLQAAGVPMPRR